MNAGFLEWWFFGGPVELMVGIPLLFGLLGVVYAIVRTALEWIAGSLKGSK